MNKYHAMVVAAAFAAGITGVAHAQGATPPERMTTPSTTNNPATATTPPPGSTAATNTPGTAPEAAPSASNGPTGSSSTGSSLGAPSSNNALNTAPAATPGAPVSGANSFTEGEARTRIQDHGFSQVSDLKLDQRGVWRGRAMRNGQSVGVALDYQGNVVAQ